MSDPNQQPSAPPPPPPTQPPAPSAAELASMPGIPIVLTPIDPPAQPPFARPAPSPYEQQSYGAPTEERPRKRRRWLLVGGITAGVVILLGVGAAVGASVISGNLGADKPVDAFLQRLVDGEAESALAMVTGADDGPLLTDEVYGGAENRIGAFTLGEPTVEGETATVVATITQGDEEYETTFALVSAGKTLLFWNDWRLDAVPLAAVAVDFDAPGDLALELGGQPLDRAVVASGPLAALPGDYAFSSPDDNANYTAAPATASVVGFGGRVGVDPLDPVEVDFPVTLTDAGQKAALAAANKNLDACIAQTVMSPVGCRYGVAVEPGVSNTNIRWSIIARPAATFGAWDGGGFPVVSTAPGRFGFVSNYTEPATRGSGTATATVDDYEFSGKVTFTGGAAAYESFDSVIDRLQDEIGGAGA